MRNVLVRPLLLVLVMLSALGVASPATAAPLGVDDFTFSSMSADMTLSRDDDGASVLRTVETLVAQFPEIDQNHGIRRMIPLDYQGVPTNIDVESVTDESGAARSYETEETDGFLAVTIATDDYVHGAQTYVITYTSHNVVKYFADTDVDEFYRDINGTGWAQPFGSVTATLRIDPEIADSLAGDLACYRGVQGSRDRCDISRAADGTITASTGDLGVGGNMSIAVAFAAGTFTPYDTSYFATPAGPLQVGLSAGVLAMLGWAIGLRRTRLKDQPGYPTVIPQYTPPPGVDALGAAVLLGKKDKGTAAEVLEQAVRGSIVILDGGRRSLTIRLVRPDLAGDADGRALLRGIFGDNPRIGEEYTFGKQDPALARSVTAILKAADREQVARGLRRAVPGWVRALPVLVTIVLAAASFVACILIARHSGGVTIGNAIAVASGIIVVMIGVLVAKRPLSSPGAELRDHLAGLKEFIEWAEADRIRMLQSPHGAERVALVDVRDPRQVLRLYEPLLPYAVVFGQEKAWARQITVYYESAQVVPYWYAGYGAFDGHSFSSSIGGITGGISSALASSSSSSSSGGSGGGGFSGGGSGGGGGGGV
ncbi:DUF2207 domain-containing protein [Microbacterium sp. ZW T5_56]|uniref:DUF2207 domain-containing protein n=1 Tax=Microbacterium sp. ZW T5_56 TaxID=3378081 RepID=UPI003853E135